MARRLETTHNLYDDALLEAGRRPLGFAICVFGIAWAAEVAGAESDSELFGYVDPLREVAVIWLLV